MFTDESMADIATDSSHSGISSLGRSEEFSFWTWNPLTITLLSVGVFLVFGIGVVSAYYIGKMRAKPDIIDIDPIEDQPSTIVIPRARPAYASGASFGTRSNSL